MLKLMYITNKPAVARIAEEAGIDRIFVDLEVLDKAKRQGGMDTVQSHHTVDDVAVIRQAVRTAEVLVRCNHIHEGIKSEIDAIIANGANIVMLPYFKAVEEVRTFLDAVGGRARTCLLVETPEAVERLDEILSLQGIDEIHIGLNDLHLALGMKFMFQLLADGTVDRLCEKIRAKGIPYGFGGIATLHGGLLPGEMVLKEHYRLGSSMVIVSRSFCNTDVVTDLEEVRRIFDTGIREMRELEQACQFHVVDFQENHERVVRAIEKIVKG